MLTNGFSYWRKKCFHSKMKLMKTSPMLLEYCLVVLYAVFHYSSFELPIKWETVENIALFTTTGLLNWNVNTLWWGSISMNRGGIMLTASCLVIAPWHKQMYISTGVAGSNDSSNVNKFHWCMMWFMILPTVYSSLIVLFPIIEDDSSLSRNVFLKWNSQLQTSHFSLKTWNSP